MTLAPFVPPRTISTTAPVWAALAGRPRQAAAKFIALTQGAAHSAETVWIPGKTTTWEPQPDRTHIVAGYGKLAQQSESEIEKSFESARRARRDRNRALRLV